MIPSRKTGATYQQSCYCYIVFAASSSISFVHATVQITRASITAHASARLEAKFCVGCCVPALITSHHSQAANTTHYSAVVTGNTPLFYAQGIQRRHVGVALRRFAAAELQMRASAKQQYSASR